MNSTASASRLNDPGPSGKMIAGTGTAALTARAAAPIFSGVMPVEPPSRIA